MTTSDIAIVGVREGSLSKRTLKKLNDNPEALGLANPRRIRELNFCPILRL